MKRDCISILLCAVVLVRASLAIAAEAPDQAGLEKVLAAAELCESGQSFEPFRQLEEWVRLSHSQPALRPQLERGLIRLLAPTASLEARRCACKQLAIIGTPNALPALGEMLKTPATADFACLALTTFPPGPADELLRGALASAEGLARVQIINTLGDRRDAPSVRLLVPAAWSKDRAVAEAGIAALGKIGTPEARNALAALRLGAPLALQPAVLDATLRCAEQLARRGERNEAAALYEVLLAPAQPFQIRRSAFAALLRLEPSQAAARIQDVLRRADGALIPVGIAAIPSLPAKVGSEPFVRELPLLQPEEQVLLLNSLALRGDDAALIAVSKYVDSYEPSVRRAAIAALGRAGDIGAVPVLTLALSERKAAEDLRAVEAALVDLGGGSATDESIMKELDGSSGAQRVVMVSVVAKRLGPAADPLLLREASNPDPLVAVAALRALGRSARPQDVPALLAMLAEAYHSDVYAEAESAAAQALPRIEDLAHRSKVVREALDRAQTLEGRRYLLALLPGCGDAPALVSLQAAAVSSEVPIQEAAIQALADWPDAAAWDALAGVYRQAQKESLRNVALRGLVRLAGDANAHPDAALVAKYRGLLEAAKGDSEVKLILGALAGVAHPGALELAQPLVERAGVRTEAEVAVQKISASLKDKRPQVEEEAPPKAPAKQ